MTQSDSSNTDNLMTGGRSPLEKTLDNGFKWLTFAFALSIGLILISVAIIIAVGAFPAIKQFNFGFFTNSNWNPVTDEYGVIAVVYGTIVSSLIALIIAIPLGVGAAVFLSEDFIPDQIRTVLVFLVELLAAIPSVVYGLWGIFVLIPITTVFGTWLHGNFGWFPLFSSEPAGPGMLPAGIVLSIMVLPIIIAISRDSLASLPPDLRQASLGLGATRWETIFRVLIPAAISGIMGGVMLALGRAMGETMAATMIIGNSNRLSISILDPANTIASLIANQFAEASGLQISALMYAGLVLMLLTLIVNILAEYIVNQVKAKYE
ncbi:MAG: phosphate ABC transporter permease subunit PstC [Cyanobacteria bacterium]|nr:phosphate ABC transporter permease subunit PstC [Cyanobacteria bacterium CG_2015-16_32_12]NCO78033.1 phosphate ABC transporter permease subunit PstC [Cyanobacteria bacterium CG_2015-22_32_23]NCQ05175.1 phosphate ABC transporter permease subunit PstC [Cyanobacteria bacterium CG_2015-09_32_10]NCQ43087.1 phosphate ABC transporter permease subunit PstC [Cyanobacteria bacterium CG_2015-04_32_10]NCS83702.1 phosphate ABC transporter permease subunit PstC [Cyanobacteria bacterium CG_2015-02_32_10]